MKYLEVFFLLFSRSTPEEAEIALTKKSGIELSIDDQKRIADSLELYRQETLKRQIILRDRYYRNIA